MEMEEPRQVVSSDYDVFISFRGKDTRNTFVGHLYSALKGRRIRAFIDSKDLRKGEDIENLLNVISGCKLSIAVISQRYAESKWCLKELSQMLQCHKTNSDDDTILPIFFKVDPSDVKNQTGCFEISHQTHPEESHDTLSGWKKALEIAGKKSGWVHQDGDDESKLVKHVVKDVLTRLNMVCLLDAKHPVGLASRAQRVRNLLSDENSSVDVRDVRFLGIYGQGGIGKTTIAADVYNSISESFSKKCFLGNVREEASKPNGLLSLQNNLISQFNYRVERKACSLREGSQQIKDLFQGSKTLLVLDDVDNPSQLNELAGAPSWFGPKSRIIITTRDWIVLCGISPKNKKIHEYEELNLEESLKLFSLHAFQEEVPPDNFMQISLDIVRTTGGLPLALEVLGSDLSMTRDEEHIPIWESMLKTLQRIPHDAVFEKLKISFDSLHENEKAMFLDVACLFIGWNEEIAISAWEACGFESRFRLHVLKRKALLKIISGSAIKYLSMQDQIRNMGRRIAYNQESGNPHNYSRIWSHMEALKVLKSVTGNKVVEGLFLNLEEDINFILYTQNLEKMPKLRLLKIDGASMEGSFQQLPSALKWFQWHRCPLKKLSTNSFHEHLVMLDLSHGSFRQAWKNWRENERFQQLKVLRLSYCESLSQSPDFSGFPKLKRLYLDHCTCMVTLHKSIVELQHLVYLNLECCSSLKELPNNICSMKTLENLILKECKSLNTFPGSIGELKESLIELSLDGTNIEALPDGVASLNKLKVLSLSYKLAALMPLPELENLTSLCEFLVGRVYVDISVLYPLVESLGSMKVLKILKVLSLGVFCVKIETFRGFVNTSNIELRELINRMGRYSSVVTNESSWLQRQDKQGMSSSLGSSINGTWRQIWMPLQMIDDGSLKRYLIPNDIDEISDCRLVAHVTLNFHSTEDKDTTFIQETRGDISLTFDSYVHMRRKKFAYKIGLAIEGSNKLIGPGQVEYFHSFEGFDWFGVQLEGIDAIEISDVSVNFMLWLEVLGVNLFLVRERDQKCQTYNDQRCFEIVKTYAPTEADEVSNLLPRKKRSGLNVKCSSSIIVFFFIFIFIVFILMKKRSSVADYLITETIRCMTLSSNRFCFSS